MADLSDLLASGDDRVEVITLVVRDVEFCIDITAVREIRGWTPATPIPHSPDHVKGVINLRGLVMPVLDLAARLGLGQTEPSGRHVIVVVQSGDKVAGLLVDGVQETFHVDAAQLQAPPGLCDGAEGGFVDAILALEGRMISRLTISRVLAQDAAALAA